MKKETEIIDGSAAKDDTYFPKCNDPELQRWMFKVMKENNAELQAALEARLEELLANSGRKRAGKARQDVPPSEPVSHQSSKKSSRTKSKAEEEAAAAPQDVVLEPAKAEEVPEDNQQVAPVAPQDGPPINRKNTTSSGDDQSNSTWSSVKRAMFKTKGPTATTALGEPVPLTGIHWFMRTPIDITAGVLIAISTLVVYLQLDWEGYKINVRMDRAEPGAWVGAEDSFLVLENLFCVLFLLELILRLWYFRCNYFLDKLNVLDGAIVVITSLDTFIFSNLESVDFANLSFIRMIRFAKLVRTLRFLRTMQLCHQLRVLIRTILSSFMSLFWSMLILAAFMLMSALFLCQTLQEFLNDDGPEAISDATKDWVNKNYGTASKALWTMFEITFSGGWPGWVRTIIEDVTPMYSIFFVIYVGGVVFAVIRIITALFLKETLAVAANDAEMMVQQKLKEKEKFAKKLEEVFAAADESGDGLVTWQEFKAMIEDPKAKAHLSNLELEAHEVESLFDLLDDGDGNVSFDEFLKGVVRLKGTARSQDVLAILHDSKKVLNHIINVERSVKRMAVELDVVFEDTTHHEKPPPVEEKKDEPLHMVDLGGAPPAEAPVAGHNQAAAIVGATFQ